MTKLKPGDAFAYDWSGEKDGSRLCWAIFSHEEDGKLFIVAARPVWVGNHRNNRWQRYEDYNRLPGDIVSADKDAILTDWVRALLMNEVYE